jgi:hypothetical protein
MSLITVHKDELREFSYDIQLKKPDGESSIGLIQFIPTFVISQSIALKAMFMKGVYVDGLGLLDKNYIGVGDEIEITLYNREEEEEYPKLQKSFFITEFSQASQSTNTKRKQMVITAMTKPGLLNKTCHVNKSVKGTAETIIKDIATRNLDIDASELVDLQGTDGSFKLIYNHARPFDVIDDLSSRAISSDGAYKDNLFFFYETIDGFKFRNIREMVKTANTFDYIQFPTNSRTDTRDDYYRILDFKHSTVTNLWKLIEDGILENTTVTFDILNRNIETSSFNYQKDKGKINTLGSFSFFNEDVASSFLPNSNTSLVQDKSVFSQTAKDVFLPSEVAYDRIETKSRKIGPTEAQRHLLQQNSITVKVPGNVKILPGDILNIETPARDVVAEEGDNPRQPVKKFDARTTGRFIVASVRHDLAEGRVFDTILDLYKDAYETNIMESE